MKTASALLIALLLSATASADTFYSFNYNIGGNDVADWQNFTVTQLIDDQFLEAQGSTQLGIPTTIDMYGYVHSLHSYGAFTMVFTFAQPIRGVGIFLKPGPPSPDEYVWMTALTTQGDFFSYQIPTQYGQEIGIVDATGENIIQIAIGANAYDEAPFLADASELSIYDFGAPAPVPEPTTLSLLGAGLIWIGRKLCRS